MELDENQVQDDLTPLQEAYLQKILRTYQANLYFFKDKFPEVFKRLMAVELPLPFEMDGEGKVVIHYRDFKGGYAEYTQLCKLIYEVFDDPERRPAIRVTTPWVDDIKEAAPHYYIPRFHEYVEPQYRFELIERFKEMCPEAEDRYERPDFGVRKMPIALVFGSGFGWHLPRLVDDYEIRHLILIDTDPARLNLSLYFVDYLALHQRFQDKGFYFTVVLDEDAESLSEYLRALLHHYWPPYFVQGAGLFFHDYDSERVKKVWETLSRDLWTLYRGWGFMDDEILGLKHAVQNSISRYPLYTQRPTLPAKSVAFVVGAGPSLDDLLPILRREKDRAVIISCGSAVTALARAGIKPDWHVEIERTEVTYLMAAEPITAEILCDVPIIASSIMHPAVFTLTNRPLMFLKDLDSGAAINDFGGSIPRIQCNPTCTNGGLSIALSMGFEEIYLAGVDLGFKDINHHHAKTSIYYDDESEQTADLEKIIEDVHAAHKTGQSVPANYGGEVLSIEIFIHTRDAMQMAIRQFSGSRVFNLNDGAAIKGAEPLRPEELSLPSTQEIKQAAMTAALAAFTDNYDINPFENLGHLAEQITAVQADMRRIFEQPLKDKMSVCDVLYDLHHYLFSTDVHRGSQVFPMMRGSLLHLERFFFDCLVLIKDEEKALEYARFAFDLFGRFLEASRGAVLRLSQVGLDQLSEPPRQD